MLYVSENIGLVWDETIIKDTIIFDTFFSYKTIFSLLKDKIIGRELLAMKCEQYAMVDYAAKWFDQIAYQGFSVEPEPMINTDINVETEKTCKTFDVIEKDSVSDVKGYVKYIFFYPGVSSFPIQFLEISGEKCFGNDAFQS